MVRISKVNTLLNIIQIASVIFLILVVALSYFSKIPFENISTNPFSNLGIPIYMGLIQRISMVFWCGIIFISFFTFFVLEIRSSFEMKFRNFLAVSFFLFGYLLLDELFLLHGLVIPKFIGIHQLTVLILYAVVAIIFVLFFKDQILNTRYIYFVIAVLLLASSVLIDILSYLKILDFRFRYLLDDGFKFLGIVNLFLFYFYICTEAILKSCKNSLVTAEPDLKK